MKYTIVGLTLFPQSVPLDGFSGIKSKLAQFLQTLTTTPVWFALQLKLPLKCFLSNDPCLTISEVFVGEGSRTSGNDGIDEAYNIHSSGQLPTVYINEVAGIAVIPQLYHTSEVLTLSIAIYTDCLLLVKQPPRSFRQPPHCDKSAR